MEWLARMEKALDYLEDNLQGEPDIREAARVACSSPFHFQRMFSFLTGMTVAEYVRKRRLTLAARELASSGARVLDVAMKYGYDSPESFAKAFRKVHGINPSAARAPGVVLKAYLRISFHLSVKGDRDMEYRLVEQTGFTIVGRSIRTTTRDQENLRRIPEFWDECCASGLGERLRRIGGDLLGVCMEFSPDMEEFTYVIGVRWTGGSPPADLESKEIPAATWAVFTSVGPLPGAIQKVWERIFSEWFPASGYEHADAPEIEVYPPGDGQAPDYRCEVWIPVVKK